MTTPLSIGQARNIVEKLRNSMIRDECRGCECLQGVLVQIEIHASQDVTDITGPLKVPLGQMHSCLGCDPCPPAEIFGRICRPVKL